MFLEWQVLVLPKFGCRVRGVLRVYLKNGVPEANSIFIAPNKAMVMVRILRFDLHSTRYQAIQIGWKGI